MHAIDENFSIFCSTSYLELSVIELCDIAFFFLFILCLLIEIDYGDSTHKTKQRTLPLRCSSCCRCSRNDLAGRNIFPLFSFRFFIIIINILFIFFISIHNPFRFIFFVCAVWQARNNRFIAKK